MTDSKTRHTRHGLLVRYATLAAVTLLAMSARQVWAQGAAPGRPNVIVILTDDQGTLDLNIYGSEDLVTPNLDALARSGVRFTQFYAAAPVCSPSRAALLTGRTPLRADLPGNASPAPVHDAPGGEDGLPGSEITLAEMLSKAGYATAAIGKWHLGTRPEMRPLAQGFDYFFGFLGGCIDNHSHYMYWNGPNRHDLWENGQEVFYPSEYFPDLMTRKAARFMERNRDDPFFLYIAINMPHYPVQPAQKWRRYYQDLPYPRNLYAAFVSTMDARIGRLIDKVEALGLRKETLIIFQSDHGHSVEVRAHGGGGNAGPYRGAKFSLFEGGIRVPAIVSMPGTVPEGEVRYQRAVGVDWLPTVADFTGVELPDRIIDGESLRRVILEDAPSPHEVIHWQVGTGEKAQWAVRKGPWKLIGNPRDPTETGPPEAELFLSNLEKDKTERTNFADAYPDVLQRLRRLHCTWLAQVGETTEKPASSR